ncbi:MFS transporter [Sphingopyxis lindanitolerans]|uniref:MFS transporter n=1 Tax=Sphingopyxis lindanitolerans TaxID=2054227 RepID=A0A2S8B564_9SPHN|nr:peptide MFS transporter [Sphingopyxis lindanitolerans]PQM27542.1 MFS transporter [Sphingopyxis lindanitolerans]
MTIAEATPDFEADHSDRAFLGHPKGLGYLAFVEGCERFSYYSMQTLLVLYMVNYLLLPEHAAGVVGLETLRGWYGGIDGQPFASKIFGDYTSLVYLTPILGGLIADRWLGRRTTLILGGLVMAVGHFLMAFEGAFLFALLALIVGVGLFKGNIASQVGELYGPNDLRRAMAFQIFYIAINVSVIAAPLISGTLGEKVGWHWGFATAGVVMVLGLILYIMAGPWLPPDNRPSKNADAKPAEPMTRQDWLRISAVLTLVPVLAVALLTNQEIFNAYLVWADQHFQLSFFGTTLPTSWMITIDAAASFSMLAAVAAFYVWYGKRHREPDELGKMIIGSVFTIAGGLCLVFAAATQGDGKIGLFWPVMFHLLNSIGFAHILPVSLALFTKLAPARFNATIIGIYYLAFFAANYIVGTVGGWYSSMPTTSFWLFHVGTATVGLVAFILFKLFLAKRLMGGAPDER